MRSQDFFMRSEDFRRCFSDPEKIRSAENHVNTFLKKLFSFFRFSKKEFSAQPCAILLFLL